MTNEKLYEVLGDINEKHVCEARAYHKAKKPVWIKWGVMAACLCLVAVGAFVSSGLQSKPDGAGVQPGGTPGSEVIQPGNTHETAQPARTNLLVVNEVERVMGADMDVQLTSFNKLPYDMWMSVLEEFHGFVGITYEEFTAKIPNIFEYRNFYSLSTRGFKDANLTDEYRLHDYVFEYQTESGGEATIAICSNEEPLRDYFVTCDHPKQSEINGVPVLIYGHEDSFMVQFSHGNINYDIGTSNITLEELEDLLTRMTE